MSKKIIAVIVAAAIICIAETAVIIKQLISMKSGSEPSTAITEVTEKAETAKTTVTTKPETTVTTTEATTKKPEVSSDEWKAAYKKYLRNYHTEASEPKYNLIYIDDDLIPELVITEGNVHIDTCLVLTYYDGEVKELGSFGSWGTLDYFVKSSVILSGYGNQGHFTNYVYKLENGKIVELFSGESEIAMDGLEHYYISGKEISKEEYDKQKDAVTPDEIIYSVSYEYDGIPITDETIENF